MNTIAALLVNLALADPSVAIQMGTYELELAVRLPISGRNLANGNSLTLGFFFPWALQ